MATSTTSNVRGYAGLLAKFLPRPIRNEQQYQRALKQADRLIRKQQLTRAEDDLLELYAALITQYEEKHHPAPDVPPGKVVAHLIEVRNTTKAEVARETGIPRQTITNIVNGSRGISKANRIKLANFFNVPADVFVE